MLSRLMLNFHQPRLYSENTNLRETNSLASPILSFVDSSPRSFMTKLQREQQCLKTADRAKIFSYPFTILSKSWIPEDNTIFSYAAKLLF